MNLKYDEKQQEKLRSNQKKRKQIEEKIVRTNEKIQKLKREIANDARRLNTSESEKKRKERTKKLIEAGALLEIAELLYINKAILLGYFLKFHLLGENEILDCKIKGESEFYKRELRKLKLKKKLEENK